MAVLRAVTLFVVFLILQELNAFPFSNSRRMPRSRLFGSPFQIPGFNSERKQPKTKPFNIPGFENYNSGGGGGTSASRRTSSFRLNRALIDPVASFIDNPINGIDQLAFIDSGLDTGLYNTHYQDSILTSSLGGQGLSMFDQQQSQFFPAAASSRNLGMIDMNSALSQPMDININSFDTRSSLSNAGQQFISPTQLPTLNGQPNIQYSLAGNGGNFGSSSGLGAGAGGQMTFTDASLRNSGGQNSFGLGGGQLGMDGRLSNNQMGGGLSNQLSSNQFSGGQLSGNSVLVNTDYLNTQGTNQMGLGSSQLLSANQFDQFGNTGMGQVGTDLYQGQLSGQMSGVAPTQMTPQLLQTGNVPTTAISPMNTGQVGHGIMTSNAGLSNSQIMGGLGTQQQLTASTGSQFISTGQQTFGSTLSQATPTGQLGQLGQLGVQGGQLTGTEQLGLQGGQFIMQSTG